MTTPRTISLATLIDEFAREDWGFTGTRAGMVTFQSVIVRRVLVRGQPTVFRHGGAWGADMQAHVIWKQAVRKTSRANVWPAHESRAVLFRNDERVDVEDVMEPLTRNICVVERSKFMIAAPHKEQEEQRSGTWQAIRAAISRRRPILIIWPKSQRLTLHRDDVLYRVSYTLPGDD
jgi:hypothetical protein